MSYRTKHKTLCTWLLLLGSYQLHAAQTLPENIAPRARISADSEHSRDYLAKNVADGAIPATSGNADTGRAWCVNGSTHRNRSDIRFEWREPVTVGEIVYYGRTAFQMRECWKQYEVLSSDSTKPILTGELKMVHGPQRITLPRPVRTRNLLIRFTSSYGGSNPGASEIEVYPARLTAKAFKQLETKAHVSPSGVRRSDQVDCEKLGHLIREHRKVHGASYRQYEEHTSAFEKLQRRNDVEQELSRLQRKVLLFDVNKLVAIRRHEIKASHVYTYHYEGFKPGGGLYVFDAHNPEKEPLELVSSGTGQILDCDLSYDGRIALFSWRRRQDEGYHL